MRVNSGRAIRGQPRVLGVARFFVTRYKESSFLIVPRPLAQYSTVLRRVTIE